MDAIISSSYEHVDKICFTLLVMKIASGLPSQACCTAVHELQKFMGFFS